MPTYIYETIPACTDEPVERLELRQSMKDAPFTKHPASGKPVRRVITGGFGFIKVRSAGAAVANSTPPAPSCCPGCHD